jgi:hypothetical protein
LINRGASIGHHSRLGDFVSIGPSVTLAGDVTVGMGAVIGACATILPSLTVGENAVVGAVITQDVPVRCLAVGNPARIARHRGLQRFDRLMSQPVVHLYAVCWDEADMLGFFFRHYDPWVNRYVIYDDDSTDGSREILRTHPKVEPRDFTRVEANSFALSHKAMQDEAWTKAFEEVFGEEVGLPRDEPVAVRVAELARRIPGVRYQNFALELIYGLAKNPEDFSRLRNWGGSVDALNIRAVEQRDSSIGELDQTVQSRDHAILNLTATLAAREQTISDLMQAAARREQHLADIGSELSRRERELARRQSSFSWRSTAFIRSIGLTVKKVHLHLLSRPIGAASTNWNGLGRQGSLR